VWREVHDESYHEGERNVKLLYVTKTVQVEATKVKSGLPCAVINGLGADPRATVPISAI